jgi:pimeloyl-ACP methyl ester carboxylesterase
VVLLGHSYAGIVVTGAADRIPERLAKVVYLESGPVPDGVSYLDMEEPAAKERDERQVAETGDGWRLAMPSWEELERVNGASLEGLGGAERNWIRDHATDQPFATYTQPLRLRGTQAEPLPKVLISSSFPLDQVRELIKAGHPWFAPLAGPEWQLLELRTGHWPLASRPGDLADLLDQQVA